MKIEDFERRSDPNDAASDLEASIIQDGIKHAATIKGPVASGFCLNPRCGEQIATDEQIEAINQGNAPEGLKRWCDADCRNTWQFIQDHKARR